jgi:hypothetical protein
MPPEARSAVRVLGAGLGLFVLCLLAGGVALLVSGRISGLLPALLGPVGLVAVVKGYGAAGALSLRHDIPTLIGEVNAILGSTVTYGPAADWS